MDSKTLLFQRSEAWASQGQGGVQPHARPADSLRAPVSGTREVMREVADASEEPASRRSGTMAVFERRIGERLEVELDVSVGTDSHYFTAQARDLSCGGLFVESYRALSLGEELSIEFELPAGRVVAKAVVCWAREAEGGRSPGYGVAFREMSRFTRPLIESFCRSLAGVPSSRRMAG